MRVITELSSIPVRRLLSTMIHGGASLSARVEKKGEEKKKKKEKKKKSSAMCHKEFKR